MKAFELSLLLWPCAAIGLLTFVVSLRITHNAVTAYSVAIVKTALFVVYFGVFFDGTYTFLDDWTYFEGGVELMEQGVGLWNLPEQWELLLALGGGDHFLYYIYNAYAIELFGASYFAPVACNILLTIAVAVLGANLARTELRLSRQQSRWFYLVLLLHPDILAWSTVVNGKDIATLLLHVLLLQAVALFLRGRLLQATLIAMPVCLVLTFMRFYVPFMFVAALLLSSLWARRERGHFTRLLVAGLLVGTALVGLIDQVEFALQVANETLVNPLYGFLRVVLTPIPFHTEEAYAFLDVPALIHWLLFPFAVIGFITLSRMRTRYARFFIIYLLVFLCLYAVVGELQGPRHRVQLDYAIALLQFIGLLRAAHQLRAPIAARRPPLQHIPSPA